MVNQHAGLVRKGYAGGTSPQLPVAEHAEVAGDQTAMKGLAKERLLC